MYEILKNESRIYDFLFYNINVSVMEAMIKEHGDIYERPYRDLKNFLTILPDRRKELKKYYTNDLFIYAHVRKYIHFYGVKSCEEYLEKMDNLPDEDIKNIVRDSVLFSSGGLEDMSFEEALDKFPIDSSEKWNIYRAYNFPKKTMHEYTSLMREFLPTFNEMYDKLLPDFENYSKEILAILKKEKENFFYNMWNGLYDDDNTRINLEDAKKVRKIIISYLFPLIASKSIIGPDDLYLLGRHLLEEKENLINVYFKREEHIVSFFKNLGDLSRFKVLLEIVKGNGLNMNIAKELGISTATTSYHLMNLQDSNIIKRDTSRKGVYYIFNKTGTQKGLDALMKFLADYEE